MRSTPVGLVMLNDERAHVHSRNEGPCMKVLRAWADALRDGLRCRDGTRAEIVVASETVKNVRTAQKLGEELLRAGVRQLVMCYNVWNFPFLCWPLLNTLGQGTPVLSLSNNEGRFPGNVGLLATDGALRQAGLRTHRIVGDVSDAETRKKVVSWCRASIAATTMRNEVYGLYGGHSMGMETGYWHLVPVLKSIGTTARQIDQLWLVEAMKEVDGSEVRKGREWFEGLLGERLHYDGKMLTPETLERQIELYLAMRAVNEEKGFDLVGLKGQRELTEYVCLGDVAEMLMNDPYDWNGPKEATVCATEADAFAALTMQALKYVTGGLPTLFMDVRLYHPEIDIWDWCNSGNHASWYAKRSDDPEENFSVVTFHPALELYFKAGGASVEFDAAPGRMTFARLGLWDDRPFMFIVPGEVVELPAEKRRELNEQTDPTWPHVHARLDCQYDEFIRLFPCNHVIGVPGDLTEELVAFCELTRITPVLCGPRGRERIAPIWERA